MCGLRCHSAQKPSIRLESSKQFDDAATLLDWKLCTLIGKESGGVPDVSSVIVLIPSPGGRGNY